MNGIIRRGGVLLCVAILIIQPGIFVISAHAQATPTFIEDDITSDTTWTADESPYRVVDSIVVEENTTLTIKPGVRVEFAATVGLEVQGNLSAIGTPTDKILFTSSQQSPSLGDWNGLSFTGGADNRVDLKHVRIAYGTHAMNIERTESSFVVSNSVFQQNKNDAVLVDDASTVRMSQTELVENGGGIKKTTGENVTGWVFTNNTFSNNDGFGIKLSADRLADVRILDNEFRNNAGDRISNTPGDSISISTRVVFFADPVALENISVRGNTMHGGISIAIEDSTSKSRAVRVTDNTVTDGATGIFVDLGQTASSISIAENSVKNAEEDGIQLSLKEFAVDTWSDISLSNNSVSDSETGIDISADSDGSYERVIVKDNNIRNNEDGLSVSSISLTVVNNTIIENNYGVSLSNSRDINISRNEIANSEFGIDISGDRNVNISNNNIYNNSVGADVSSSSEVSAENNYWGASSGPYHPSINPEGTGDEIDGNLEVIDFIPFLESPVEGVGAPVQQPGSPGSDSLVTRFGGGDGEIDNFDVLRAVNAANSGTQIGGQPVSNFDVLQVVNRVNQG